MKDFSNYPPQEFFEECLEHYPEVAYFYKVLWYEYDHAKNKKLKYDKKKIRDTYLISPTLFRNNLMKLQRLDLLTFEERNEYEFIITSMYHSEKDKEILDRADE